MLTATGNEGFLGSLNILIIEDLIIFPAARGAGRGLLTLRALVHHFRGSVGLIVTRPLPLQHFTCLEPTSEEYHRLGLYEFTLSAAKSLKAVRRFFARFGFVRLLRTDLMLLNPAWPLPSVDELKGRPSQATPEHRAERLAPPRRPVATIYAFPNAGE